MTMEISASQVLVDAKFMNSVLKICLLELQRCCDHVQCKHCGCNDEDVVTQEVTIKML